MARWLVNSAALLIWGVSVMISVFQIRRPPLCGPQPAHPAPTALPPAPRFGHLHPAAGAVHAAGTDEASAAELAPAQLHSQLVESRASWANANCDILGFCSSFMERQGLLCTSGWWGRTLCSHKILAPGTDVMVMGTIRFIITMRLVYDPYRQRDYIVTVI